METFEELKMFSFHASTYFSNLWGRIVTVLVTGLCCCSQVRFSVYHYVSTDLLFSWNHLNKEDTLMVG